MVLSRRNYLCLLKGCPPKALLLDMDGVLYHGSRVLPHAIEFLNTFAHLPHLFITNNPIATPQEVVQRLAMMGFARPAVAEVLTSAVACAAYLQQLKPGFRYFAVGAPGLDQALSKYGIADESDADFVVVGEGEGLDYASLTLGINLIVKKAATLISTNPDHSVDATLDGEHRLLPGGGALVAPFEVAAGVKAVTMGKPEPLLYQMALKQLGLPASDCVMIGDRVDTDIAGAQALEIRTALVRTGRFAPGEPWPPGMRLADWDVADLAELTQAWKGCWPDLADADNSLGLAR